MGFIAGPYVATFNAQAMGQTAEGYRLSWEFFKRLITGDAFAEAPQDGVYRGAQMHLAATLIEYNAAAVAAAVWPYHATMWTTGQVGRLDVGTSLIKQIVLTAVAGTPAATVPATLTIPKAILAEGFPVEILFAPDLREVPLRFRAYPDASTGVFAAQT